MGCTASLPEVQEHLEGFHTRYKVGRKLGDGAFGQVCVLTDKISGSELAVKIVNVRCRDKLGGYTGEVDRKRLRLAKNEAECWRELGRHDEHCVKLAGVFFEQSVYYMAMEKCQGTLMHGLAEMQATTEADLGRIFNEMVSAISHVHKMGFVHRDVKPDNFLYSGPRCKRVKLCDFGLTARMPKTGMLKGVFGTVPYMSPEMLKGTGYDQRTDIWSLGATVYQILYGCHPYSSKKNQDLTKKAILSDTPALTFPDSWSKWGTSGRLPKEAVSFVSSLMRRQPAERCSAAEALAHPFVALRGPKGDSPASSFALGAARSAFHEGWAKREKDHRNTKEFLKSMVSHDGSPIFESCDGTADEEQKHTKNLLKKFQVENGNPLVLEEGDENDEDIVQDERWPAGESPAVFRTCTTTTSTPGGQGYYSATESTRTGDSIPFWLSDRPSVTTVSPGSAVSTPGHEKGLP